ncbi:MAG: hypothetical protein FWC67_00540 [Defluviitaleaceae bacterium]|nr:hypothetical protein [Defluviitaleaceae bacterium]
MKKKLLGVLMLCIALFVVAACGNNNEQDTTTTTTAPATTAATEAEPAADNNAAEENADDIDAVADEDEDDEPAPIERAPSAAQGLEGSWYFLGMPYYVFEANGRGTMADLPIYWQTSAGILSICSTPSVCGSIAGCVAPSRWEYTISGNNLSLDSMDVPGMNFDYTRR